MQILQAIRNIWNTYCTGAWVCGEPITATKLNEMLLNGKAAFRNGQLIASANSNIIGNGIIVPVVGLCYNYIQGKGNDSDTETKWNGGTTATRFQPAYPYYHDYIGLTEGCDLSHGFGQSSQQPTPFHTLPIINPINQAQGKGHLLLSFENPENNRVLVQAHVRRGLKYLADWHVYEMTTANSEGKIYVLEDTDTGTGNTSDYRLAYTQHLEIWIECLNASNITQWVKIADDTDFPANTYTEINKIVTIPQPQPANSSECRLWVYQWFEMPLEGSGNNDYYPVGSTGHTQNAHFHAVMGTASMNKDFTPKAKDPNGIISLNIKAFKEC